MSFFDPAKKFYKEGKKRIDKNDFSGAIKDFNEAIKINPHYAEAYNYRGIAKFKYGLLADGYRDLEKAGEFGFKKAFETLKTLKNSRNTTTVELKKDERKNNFNSIISKLMNIEDKLKKDCHMTSSNRKRIPITDKYVDSEGIEQQRGSSTDIEFLPLRCDNGWYFQIVLDENYDEINKEFLTIAMEYEKGNYEIALRYLNLLIKKQSFEPFLYYYKRICERVISQNPNSKNIRDKIRCKWCGQFTQYIDPNVPTYGLFPQSNSCSSCGRMYPSPSWVWDSEEGRAYSYYRGSFIDKEFYEEFEEDYEPTPLSKQHRKVEKHQPAKAFDHYNRGVRNDDLGNSTQAMLDYTKTIDLDPKFDLAYFSRGFLKYKLGDKEGALKDYDKTIELNPNLTSAHCNRGYTKSDLGDNSGALSDFNKAIGLDPNYVMAFFGRAHVKNKLGDYKGAIADFNRVIEFEPDFAKAYLGRGFAESEISDFKSAMKDFDMTIEISPNDAFAYSYRAFAKFELEDYHGAITDFTKAIVLDQNLTNIYYNRGVAKCALGDYQSAIMDFTKSIDWKPKHIDAYYERGNANYKLGNKSSACEDWKRAFELGCTKAYELIQMFCK